MLVETQCTLDAFAPHPHPQALGVAVCFLEGVMSQLLLLKGIGVSLEQGACTLELDRETFLGSEKRGQNYTLLNSVGTQKPELRLEW